MLDSFESFCNIFADDTKDYTAVGDKTDHEKLLQRDIILLSELGQALAVEFSVQKCKVVECGYV